MSVLFSGMGSSGGYSITNSVRLRAAASAYFSRTWGTPTSNNKWTVFMRVKRSTLGAQQALFGSWKTASLTTQCYFDSSDRLRFFQSDASGVTKIDYVTNRVFRDPSAWLNITIGYDNTIATTAVSIQINLDTAESSFATSTNSATQNGNYSWNQNAVAHYFGVAPSTAGTLFGHYDGYGAEWFVVDGQKLDASSWVALDSNNVPAPKSFGGTYGLMGCKLDFKDAALTAGSNAGLGKDVSGNGNYWTTNNISVTSGVTYDSMVDTPTNNYATLNPINKGAGASNTLSAGNLTYSSNSASGSIQEAQHTGSIAVSSGKWYWEFTPSNTITAYHGVCLVTRNMATTPFGAGDILTYGNNATKENGTSTVGYGATYTTNDVIGVALDFSAGTLEFYKNGAAQGTAYSSVSGTYVPFLVPNSSNTNPTGNYNFGQRPFTYTPPTGFKALCTANLPVVAITKPALHFDVALWTGNNTARSITQDGNGNNLQMNPEFIWGKSRGSATGHLLYDVVRGVDKSLATNNTAAEDTTAGQLTAFSASPYGFQLPTDTSGYLNFNARTMVGGLWKANGAGSSNTSGSITSTVSANTTAGFSIVTYTGTGANATVGHGLGVAPKFIIIKHRSAGASAGVNDWGVYSDVVGNTKMIRLNLTNAESGTSATYWNNTSPTTTTFSLGSFQNHNEVNGLYVAYCFAEIPGYSKFGSYVANNSADGPFVFCGFRPRYLMIKSSTYAGTSWELYDVARSTYNAMTDDLRADSSAAAPITSAPIDVTANGFKIRSSNANLNNGTDTFIFAAFAEYPFGGSNCSPSPAR